MKLRHFLLFSLLLFSFFSIVFNLHIPVIWPDEVLFFNPASELQANGIMRTSVLDGLIPGMETHTLWMPPLYILLLSGIFQIFPTELLTARLFSSFISLGSIYLVYLICLKYSFSIKRTIGVLIFLSTDFLFLKFSHTARMESLCLFFTLAAIFFLLPIKNSLSAIDPSQTDSEPTSKLSIFLSGTCLSLSFLSHPFGIVNSIPILFLLYQRRAFNLRNISMYALAGFIPIAIWGIYVIPNWELFVVQFGAQLSRKNELLGKFTWIDKIKIIFSVYKFPTFKLGLFIISILFVFKTLLYKNKIQEQRKTYFFKIMKDKNSFFLAWLITLLFFLFVSSESWYVFHMVVPFTLALSSLLDEKIIWNRILFGVNFFYNLILIVWIPYSIYFLYKIPEKTETFFKAIEIAIERKNYIYLQAIPDPYFYLRKKFPEKTLHEFIPGELSGMQSKNADGTEKVGILKKLGIVKENYKIDANYYKDMIHKQEIFIFYNENLMNDYIREYLVKNADNFERKLIHVETPKQSGLKLDAVIFSQKQKN